MHISLNVAALVPLFQSLPRLQIRSDEDEDDDVADAPEPKKRRKIVELPNGKFGNFSYVRVYSNCRVRRIWFVSALCTSATKSDSRRQRKGSGRWRLWGKGCRRNGACTRLTLRHNMCLGYRQMPDARTLISVCPLAHALISLLTTATESVPLTERISGPFSRLDPRMLNFTFQRSDLLLHSSEPPCHAFPA